jgi:hypothetical protein
MLQSGQDALPQGAGFLANKFALVEGLKALVLFRKALLLLQQCDKRADHLRHLQEEDQALSRLENFRA